MLGPAIVLRRPAALHKRGVVIRLVAPPQRLRRFHPRPAPSEIFTHDDGNTTRRLRSHDPTRLDSLLNPTRPRSRSISWLPAVWKTSPRRHMRRAGPKRRASRGGQSSCSVALRPRRYRCRFCLVPVGVHRANPAVPPTFFSDKWPDPSRLGPIGWVRDLRSRTSPPCRGPWVPIDTAATRPNEQNGDAKVARLVLPPACRSRTPRQHRRSRVARSRPHQHARKRPWARRHRNRRAIRRSTAWRNGPLHRRR